MALFQLFIAIAFVATGGNTTSAPQGGATSGHTNTVQTALVLLGMYLFAVAYSPGEGPVPFVGARKIVRDSAQLTIITGVQCRKYAALQSRYRCVDYS